MIVDLSANNAEINWDQVKENNPKVEGVYLKASEGVGYTDSKLRYNALSAKMSEIPYGFYHFATLNNVFDVVLDAKQEAKYFISVTKEFSPKLPYALDIETNKSHLTKDQVLLWIKSFFYELEANGIKDYVLYSYAPFLNENLPANHGLSNIRLWCAAYTKELKLPNGWHDAWLWQHTNQGKVAGIKGNVDLNKKP